jgi:hypothetical protein
MHSVAKVSQFAGLADDLTVRGGFASICAFIFRFRILFFTRV